MSTGWWAKKLGDSGQQSAPPTQQFGGLEVHRAQQPAAQQPVDVGDPYMSYLSLAAVETGGSQQVKETSGKCPGCGGPNFFAMKYGENGMKLRQEAAPRCFDCGFPMVQAGSSRGGATSARSRGPARRARQVESGHAVTVMDGSTAITYQPRGN
jgi:hypothetical protein